MSCDDHDWLIIKERRVKIEEHMLDEQVDGTNPLRNRQVKARRVERGCENCGKLDRVILPLPDYNYNV